MGAPRLASESAVPEKVGVVAAAAAEPVVLRWLAPVSLRETRSKWMPSEDSATPQKASQHGPGVAVHWRAQYACARANRQIPSVQVCKYMRESQHACSVMVSVWVRLRATCKRAGVPGYLPSTDIDYYWVRFERGTHVRAYALHRQCPMECAAAHSPTGSPFASLRCTLPRGTTKCLGQ